MWKKFLAAIIMAFAAAVAMAAVDVNKASEAELDSVKGIGPATSKSIMAERKKGDFKDWQDFIKRVKGVGEKKAEQFSKAGVTVNGESYKTASAAKKDEKKETKAEAKADKKAGASMGAASGKK